MMRLMRSYRLVVIGFFLIRSSLFWKGSWFQKRQFRRGLSGIGKWIAPLLWNDCRLRCIGRSGFQKRHPYGLILYRILRSINRTEKGEHLLQIRLSKAKSAMVPMMRQLGGPFIQTMIPGYLHGEEMNEALFQSGNKRCLYRKRLGYKTKDRRISIAAGLEDKPYLQLVRRSQREDRNSSNRLVEIEPEYPVSACHLSDRDYQNQFPVIL